MEFPYKLDFSLQIRKKEGDKINRNFPDRRPVIAERHPDSEIRLANCRKYLLPFNLTLGQFYFLLRKKMGMKSDEALFLFVKNNNPDITQTIDQIYKKNCDEDGFLYIWYTDKDKLSDAEEVAGNGTASAVESENYDTKQDISETRVI